MEKNKKWYKRISNLVIIIACVILIPILLINVWIIFQAKSDEDTIPSVFNYKPFIVLSGSMETEIHKGDLIITKMVDPKTLKVDDVIAFRDAENTVTTHRIIDIVKDKNETYFVTKGDNNDSQDQNLVEYKDVEGLYVTRMPGIGSMMNSLSKPTTIIIVIMSVTMIFVIGFMISSKRQRDIEREEYLEYKRQKELEEQKAKEKEEKSKKTKQTTKRNETKTKAKKEDSKKTNSKKSN